MVGRVVRLATIFSLTTCIFISSAAALDPVQTLKVALSSAKKGASVKSFRVTYSTSMADGSHLAAARGSTVSLPRGMKLNASSFPTCSKKKLLDNYRKCPKGSKIGTGTVTLDSPAISLEKISGDLLVFNGDKKKFYLVPLIDVEGLDLSGIIITGTVSKSSGDYGIQLDFTMPKITTVSGEEDTSITDIDIPFKATTTVRKKVGGKTKKVRVTFVKNPTLCTGTWKFRTDSFFTDGSSTYSEDSVSCS